MHHTRCARDSCERCTGIIKYTGSAGRKQSYARICRAFDQTTLQVIISTQGHIGNTSTTPLCNLHTLRCDTHTHLEADRHDGLKLPMRDALHVRHRCVGEVGVRHIRGLRVPAPDARLSPAHALHAAHYLYTSAGVGYSKTRGWW
jgi:hypothetical protein